MVVNIISWLYALLCISVIFKRDNDIHAILICSVMRTIAHSLSLNFVVLNFGGFIIYHKDMLCIVLLLIMILESGGKIRIEGVLKYVYAVILFMVAAMGIGLLTYGFNSEFIGDVRKFVEFFVPLIYVATRMHEYEKDRIIKWLHVYMRIIVVFCLICWGSILFLGVNLTDLGLGTEGGGLRVLGSTYTMELAVYTLYLLYSNLFLEESNGISIETLLYCAMILILQHNSVWIAFGSGVVILFIIGAQKGVFNDRRALIQTFSFIAVAIIAFIIIINSPIGSSILATSEKYSQINQGEGTIGTRFLIWQQNLERMSGIDWILGQGFGYVRTVILNGVTTEMSIHSAYVESILCMGIPATVIMIILCLKLIVSNWNHSPIIAAVTVSILVYWSVYMYEYEVAVVLGAIISATLQWRDSNENSLVV